MRPASNFDDLAIAVEVVVDDVRVGDEVAAVAVEQLSRGACVVRLRELEQHVLFRGDQHPEMAIVAALWRLHEHPRGVSAEVRRLEGIRFHRLDERRG